MVSASKDPLTFNDLMATPIDLSKYVLNGLKIEDLTQDILLGPAFNLFKEGDRFPFDLSKPLPIKGPLGHRTIAADYFFNNDLEYLKTSDPEVNKFSKQNIYSTKAILGVKSVSVKKLHGYGHLEEIMVKRSDQQLYKFKEGDFVDLHLNDIEDMLLLAIQHRLFHLDGSDIIDFIVALRMFTRSAYIHKRLVLDFRLDYNTKMPKRKWTAVDRKRSSLMIELIDKQLREREIIINLERLVGARELDMNYKLMTLVMRPDCDEGTTLPSQSRRKSARRRVFIGEMKALGSREVAVDYLKCLKKTHARENDNLAALTKVMAKTQAGIHEKEGHVARMDLND
ncbi:hypothetical protein Tco_0672595 [Tanacetum coccineum]